MGSNSPPQTAAVELSCDSMWGLVLPRDTFINPLNKENFWIQTFRSLTHLISSRRIWNFISTRMKRAEKTALNTSFTLFVIRGGHKSTKLNLAKWESGTMAKCGDSIQNHIFTMRISIFARLENTNNKWMGKQHIHEHDNSVINNVVGLDKDMCMVCVCVLFIHRPVLHFVLQCSNALIVSLFICVVSCEMSSAFASSVWIIVGTRSHFMDDVMHSAIQLHCCCSTLPFTYDPKFYKIFA